MTRYLYRIVCRGFEEKGYLWAYTLEEAWQHAKNLAAMTGRGAVLLDVEEA